MSATPATGGFRVSPLTAKREWLLGWPLLLASAIGFGVSASRFTSVGLFMEPLQEAFGWSRGQISAALLIHSITGVATAPFYGRLIDRYGARRVALFGIPALALCYGGLSLAGPSVWTWYLGWLLLSLVVDASGPIIWMTGITRNFTKTRGLAVAVAMSGNGLVAAIMPPAVLWLIATYSWQAAYVTLAAASFAVLYPLTWLLFHDDRRAAPAPTDETMVSSPPADVGGVSFREAIHDWRFWCIGVAMLSVATVIGVALVHLLQIFTDAGMSRPAAGAALAMMGPSMIVGRLCTGFVLDRIAGTLVASASCLLSLVGCLMLLFMATPPTTAVLIAVVLGLVSGSETNIVAYLTSRYFGLKNYGTILGGLYGFFSMGVGISPTLAGFVFDTTGSYHIMLIAMSTLLAASAIAVLRLGPYPDFSNTAR